MKELTITKNDANQRLDRFVAKAVPLLPDALLQKYIRLKRIKLNGRGAKRDDRLNVGDVLQLYINDEFFDTPTEENAYLKLNAAKLTIVYEDENILLLDKKPGVLCHSADGVSYDTLIANVQAHCYLNGDWRPREEHAFSPALCNRIDRNTGGLVIAAKNAEALRVMNEKIKDREIDKYYLCAVCGRPSPASGTLKDFIFKDATKNQVYVRKTFCPGAKEAITQYKTLETRDELSLVECRLLTGRTHQIRAQMANHGTALLGDGKYGAERTNREYSENCQALYSYRLKFSFTTDGGVLNYLKDREFAVETVDFVDKYFNYNISKAD